MHLLLFRQGIDIIEYYHPISNYIFLIRIGVALVEDLRLACMDPFMSHVLEKLLILSAFAKEGLQGGIKEEERKIQN